MKLYDIFTVIFLFIGNSTFSQECDIQIEILENKYMFGQAIKLEEKQFSKNIEVNFDEEFMEVIMPLEGQKYLIKVVNEACQAYCTREKRVRQLHSGDEKLVKNLFKSKELDILRQIQECS